MYSGEGAESSSIEPTKHDDPVSDADDAGAALVRRVDRRHPSGPRIPPRKSQLRPFSGNDDERKRVVGVSREYPNCAMTDLR